MLGEVFPAFQKPASNSHAFQTKRELAVVICFVSAFTIWQKQFLVEKGLNVRISRLQTLLVCLFQRTTFLGCSGNKRKNGWIEICFCFSCRFWWLANDLCMREWGIYREPYKYPMIKVSELWIWFEIWDCRLQMGEIIIIIHIEWMIWISDFRALSDFSTCPLSKQTWTKTVTKQKSSKMRFLQSSLILLSLTAKEGTQSRSKS